MFLLPCLGCKLAETQPHWNGGLHSPWLPCTIHVSVNANYCMGWSKSAATLAKTNACNRIVANLSNIVWFLMQLEENFLQRVNSLVQASDLDFWRKGRFLVRSDNQLVSYKDGIHNYYLCVNFLLYCCSLFGGFWLWICFGWYQICIPGMTRLSKSWRTWNTPELTLVTPIAVVGGRKTSLVLKGRNLTIPGTQ